MWQEFLQRLALVDAEFTYDDVSGRTKILETLISLGLLHEVTVATHVVCDSCPEAHWEKVLWSTDGSRAFIPCPTEGAVNIDRERLRRWQMDPSQFAALLARELGLSGQVDSLPAFRVWFMGQRPVGGRNRYFFFAAIGPDELPPIMKEIRLEYGRVSGALLLPFSAQDTDENKLRIIDVSNMATLQGRRIAVDIAYIEDQFTVSRRLHPGKPESNGSAHKLAVQRRRILRAYINDKRLDGMNALSWHLNVSTSALYGMVRGDRRRYSEEKLSAVLTKIGCSRGQWNRLTSSVTPK